jgi:UDPglucose--hexose-1-phosphate uridylyltransferase
MGSPSSSAGRPRRRQAEGGPDQPGEAGWPDCLPGLVQFRECPPSPRGDAIGGVHRLDPTDRPARVVGPGQVQPLALAHESARVLHGQRAPVNLPGQGNVAPPGFLGEFPERGSWILLARLEASARCLPVASIRWAIVVTQEQDPLARIKQDDPGGEPERVPAHDGCHEPGAPLRRATWPMVATFVPYCAIRRGPGWLALAGHVARLARGGPGQPGWRVRASMSEPGVRIDPLTGACVAITPWRQHRPNRPHTRCPFCPGGLEAPRPYDLLCIANRWPGLPGGRHEVILHTPDHGSSFPALGEAGAARVVELWSSRSVALGSREDVRYVFIFENRGQSIGATIDHPHSQILAFGMIPPIPQAELSKAACGLCRPPDPRLTVISHAAWQACVPWAPSWPYELLIFPSSHVADLPAAGSRLRRGLAAILVDCHTRLERLFGEDAPYMLWIHQRPSDGQAWPAAHLHLHLAPVLRGRGTVRHLAAAELGAGVFFDPVDPVEAAAQLRVPPGQPG